MIVCNLGWRGTASPSVLRFQVSALCLTGACASIAKFGNTHRSIKLNPINPCPLSSRYDNYGPATLLMDFIVSWVSGPVDPVSVLMKFTDGGCRSPLRVLLLFSFSPGFSSPQTRISPRVSGLLLLPHMCRFYYQRWNEHSPDPQTD